MKVLFHTLTTAIKRAFYNRYFLLFSNGFVLAMLLFFYVQADYEAQLFKSLAVHVQSQCPPDQSRDSILIQSLHVTHELGKNRSLLFSKRAIENPHADLLKPLTYDLMTGQQACGGFSYVLGRLLKEMDVEIRFAQMEVNHIYGGHIIVEAKMPYGWVVLDPMFDLFFLKPNGHMAGFAEVRANWNYYKNQVPHDYNPAYAYENVRYTNWEKIPVVMPALKNLLSWSMGEEAATGFSFRNLLLKKYEILFYTMLIVFLGLFYLTIHRFFISVRKAIAEDPILLFPKTANNKQINQVPCQPVVFPSKF